MIVLIELGWIDYCVILGKIVLFDILVNLFKWLICVKLILVYFMVVMYKGLWIFCWVNVFWCNNLFGVVLEIIVFLFMIIIWLIDL